MLRVSNFPLEQPKGHDQQYDKQNVFADHIPSSPPLTLNYFAIKRTRM